MPHPRTLFWNGNFRDLGGAVARMATLAGGGRVAETVVERGDLPAFDQVADQALDVAAVVADLGVLGRLGLDERRADQHGQPAGDLGLADAGRADQHDVLGRDLPAQLVGKLPAPPAVPQRDRHGPLGVGLADDVAVELGDDLPGRQVWHGSSSTVRFSFV